MAWNDTELGLLIRLLNPYSQDMQQIPPGQAGAQVQAQPRTAQEALANLKNYLVEIDTYEGAWDFKGQTDKVTRALRITYCYPRAEDSNIFATEHVLIGFAGGNGG